MDAIHDPPSLFPSRLLSVTRALWRKMRCLVLHPSYKHTDCDATSPI